MPISDYLKGLRDYVGHDLLLIPSSAAIIFDELGRVLLQRRSDNGKWGLPGGATDPGEHPAQTAVREVFEETGLRVRPLRCAAVIKHGGSYPNGDQIEMTVSVFTCEIVGGTLESLDGESLELRFFASEDFPASSILDVYPPEVFSQKALSPYFYWDERWLTELPE